MMEEWEKELMEDPKVSLPIQSPTYPHERKHNADTLPSLIEPPRPQRPHNPRSQIHPHNPRIYPQHDANLLHQN